MDKTERSMIGRANRWLHWRDIAAFKEQGYAIYDLGGWYAGSGDYEKLSINKFKEGFGGVIQINYNAVEPISLKGKVYLELRRWLHNSLWHGRSGRISVS